MINLSENENVECTLLSYQENIFIMPTICIAKVLMIDNLELEREGKTFILGHYLKDDNKIPIITPDLSILPLNEKLAIQQKTKIAILHALYTNKTLYPFFAILFEEQPRRVKANIANIISDEMGTFLINSDTEKYPVKLLSLTEISHLIEEIIR